MIRRQVIVSSGLGLFLLCLAVPAIASVNVSNSRELIIPIDSQNKIVGVRIADVAGFLPNLVPSLATISANIQAKPSEFFNSQGKVDVVHDVFFNRLPEVNGSHVSLSLTAFVKYANGTAMFEKLTVDYNMVNGKSQDYQIQHEDSYNSKEMQFRASVGLVDRKLILEDTIHDVKIVFPIGVGSFDEGVMNEGKFSLLTPRFTDGYIDQRTVISKREKPRYFKGLPFIRLLKGPNVDSDGTPIGFHIEINDTFVRGFDSHGCMRLREEDLMALHDLIMLGTQVQTPITIQYRPLDNADHPAPKRNQTYKGILNKGTAISPFFIFDRDNLVQLTFKETGAPTDKLVDDARDNYESLFSYDTISQMKEQDLRRKNECDAKVMSGELNGSDKKKYQACLDAGKRVDTLKDRIYRKFMGIDTEDTATLDLI